MSLAENQIMINQIMHKAYSLHQQGDLKNAEALYQQILKLDPKHPDANRLLALIAFSFGHYQEALRLLNIAIVAAPKFAQNHFILGGIYKRLKEEDKAIAAYKKSISLKPDFIEAHNNLGLLYKDKMQLTDAVASFKCALKYQNTSAFTWSNLGNAYKESSRMEEALDALEKAFNVDPHFSAAYSNYLMALNYCSNRTPEFIFDKHCQWVKYCSPDIQARRFDFKNRDQKTKLRIGYISPDFHTHSVAYFIEPLLKSHNKKRFELFAYYNHSIFDKTNTRIQSYFDHWRNIYEKTSDQIAKIIFEDEIDILIDLAGHSANNTLAVLYQKPAPVQVTWLGYPNTTGLSEVDYRLSDNIADPEGTADLIHTETIYRLKNGFLCYEGDTNVPVREDIPHDRNGHITFGSFNNYVKVMPEVIEVWAQILLQIPGSKLILKSSQFADKDTKGRCIKSFKKLGVSKERLNLVPILPNPADHLSYYGEVDIALDPFPYNGTTTTFEALWMGVPTITLSGNTHVSRVGESILNRIGLESFVSHSTEEYIKLAKEKAASLEELKHHRKTLRERMLKSDICNQQEFAEQIEASYQYMWENYLLDRPLKKEKH